MTGETQIQGEQQIRRAFLSAQLSNIAVEKAQQDSEVRYRVLAANYDQEAEG